MAHCVQVSPSQQNGPQGSARRFIKAYAIGHSPQDQNVCVAQPVEAALHTAMDCHVANGTAMGER